MTISIRLDEKLKAKLSRHLTGGEKSISAFVRDAIAEKLARDAGGKSPFELGKHVFGQFKAGPDDLSVTGKRRLGAKLREKHSR